MSAAREAVAVHAECIAQTEAAIRVELSDTHRRLWIPLSQIENRTEVWKLGDKGVLRLSAWYAEERRLHVLPVVEFGLVGNGSDLTE